MKNSLTKRVLSCLVGLLILPMSSVTLLAETIYKVVQEDGTVLYTDQPVPGAIPIDLTGVNTSTVPRLATPPPVTTALSTGDADAPQYKVQVVSPLAEATIRDNAGQLAITATITPKLDSGEFHLYLDNAKVASQNFGSFILDGVNRGAHTFFVSVTDNTGKTLASSEPQTFYMHQVSVLTRPGNAN